MCQRHSCGIGIVRNRHCMYKSGSTKPIVRHTTALLSSSPYLFSTHGTYRRCVSYPNAAIYCLVLSLLCTTPPRFPTAPYERSFLVTKSWHEFLLALPFLMTLIISKEKQILFLPAVRQQRRVHCLFQRFWPTYKCHGVASI